MALYTCSVYSDASLIYPNRAQDSPGVAQLINPTISDLSRDAHHNISCFILTFPTRGLLFKHAVCTVLVQCIKERHFVLQHSSLHAHTSLSDMYHNCTGTHRGTHILTDALFHHQTGKPLPRSTPPFSASSSKAKDVVPTWLDAYLYLLNLEEAFSHLSRTEL